MTQRILSEIQKHDRRLLNLERQAANTPVRNGRGGGANSLQENASDLIRSFTVISTSAGYITCTDSITSETVQVKNLLHIAGGSITFIDGTTVSYSSVTKNSRIATVGTETQDQILTPDYYVGEIIYGFYAPDGTYDWIDLNVAGRQWAEDLSDA